MYLHTHTHAQSSVRRAGRSFRRGVINARVNFESENPIVPAATAHTSIMAAEHHGHRTTSNLLIYRGSCGGGKRKSAHRRHAATIYNHPTPSPLSVPCLLPRLRPSRYCTQSHASSLY